MMASGDWNKNKDLQPTAGNKAPQTTAPSETPRVNPEFVSPIKIPLLFFVVSSSTKMKLIVMIPAPPTPLIALPIRKVLRSGACDVTTPPMANSDAAIVMQFLGENIWAKRAAIGDMEDKPI